jgi:hypothetical protein
MRLINERRLSRGRLSTSLSSSYFHVSNSRRKSRMTVEQRNVRLNFFNLNEIIFLYLPRKYLTLRATAILKRNELELY